MRTGALLRNSVTGYGIRSSLTGYGAPTVNFAADGTSIASNTATGTASNVFCAAVNSTGLITLSGVTICSGCKNNTSPTGSWSAFGDPNGAYELCRYETSNNNQIHLARVTVPGLYVEHYAASACAGSPDLILNKLSIQVTRTNSVVSVFAALANEWIDDDGGTPAGLTHRKAVFSSTISASGCVPLSLNSNFTSCPASYLVIPNLGGFIFINGTATVEF